MSKIKDFIQQALKGNSLVDAQISFGNVFNFIAQKINADTGIDRRGSEIVAPNLFALNLAA